MCLTAALLLAVDFVVTVVAVCDDGVQWGTFANLLYCEVGRDQGALEPCNLFEIPEMDKK